MGGSILPAVLHNNKIYFLFGKERVIDEKSGWSDFGGATDNGETFLETAVREGEEELTGFLGSNKTLKKMLDVHGTYDIDYKPNGYTRYRVHIFPMKYDEKLPLYYNNNQIFLQKNLDRKIIENEKIFEKTKIKWFSFDDIKKHRSVFRYFYKNIIDIILSDKIAIEKFIRNSMKYKNVKKETKKSRKKSEVKKSVTKKRKNKGRKSVTKKNKQENKMQ